MTALEMVQTVFNSLPEGDKKKFLDGCMAGQETPQETIVRIRDAAKRIGRTTRTIHHLIRDGQLAPFIPKGRTRAWGVTSSSLEAFLKGGQSNG